MRMIFWGIVVCFLFLSNDIIFAQEDDDLPYLSDDDIAAIEMTLSFDVPEIRQDDTLEIATETKDSTGNNEISRLNTSQKIYHLLILDRTFCPNSDISGIQNTEVLYKYKHGKNGYLIAVYMSPQEGPVFPQLPAKSHMLVNLTTVRKNTIKEYINSSAFRKFVTNQKILSEIQGALGTN
jgi:hypothetical protein